MTETVLALVPEYGLSLIFAVVALACLAVPLPASVLVLTSGGFAATGDLSLASVLLVAFSAYVIGDQSAFLIARIAGPGLIGRLKRSERVAPVIARSEEMLQRRGSMAVLLSHTILSPTCPYVSYLSGSGGLPWRRFTMAAIPGALIWTGGYVMLGFSFATQLEQIAEIISQFFGIVLALCVGVAALVLLRRRWKALHDAG